MGENHQLEGQGCFACGKGQIDQGDQGLSGSRRAEGCFCPHPVLAGAAPGPQEPEGLAWIIQDKLGEILENKHLG